MLSMLRHPGSVPRQRGSMPRQRGQSGSVPRQRGSMLRQRGKPGSACLASVASLAACPASVAACLASVASLAACPASVAACPACVAIASVACLGDGVPCHLQRGGAPRLYCSAPRRCQHGSEPRHCWCRSVQGGLPRHSGRASGDRQCVPARQSNCGVTTRCCSSLHESSSQRRPRQRQPRQRGGPHRQYRGQHLHCPRGKRPQHRPSAAEIAAHCSPSCEPQHASTIASMYSVVLNSRVCLCVCECVFCIPTSRRVYNQAQRAEAGGRGLSHLMDPMNA